MKIEKEIYESEYGYGYKIYVDGKLTIIQPHAPGVPGFKGMTTSEANEYADTIIELMSKTLEKSHEDGWMPEEMRRRDIGESMGKLRAVEMDGEPE